MIFYLTKLYYVYITKKEMITRYGLPIINGKNTSATVHQTKKLDIFGFNTKLQICFFIVYKVN